MKHPESTPSIQVELIHGLHRDLIGAHHFLFGILRIHSSWLTVEQGSDTTCRDYRHHVSPHWYDIVHFRPKPLWICFWALSQKASYQLRYLSILIYP